MGLSASQARFLQLTARRSNVEYQAQQINFQRLQLSDQLAAASNIYEEKTSNRILRFSFNTGSEINKVDLSYKNYKNYMNQQLEGLSTSQDKYFLVSSSGNKIVVASEADRDAIINSNQERIDSSKMIKAMQDYEKARANNALDTLDSDTKYLAEIGIAGGYQVSAVEKDDESDSEQTYELLDKDGNKVESIERNRFSESDFMIVDDLDNIENFQSSLQNGYFFFAKLVKDEISGVSHLQTQGIDSLGGGAITDELNEADDVAAEAEYDRTRARIQNIDKKLELELNRLETERNAIETEIESITKVIDDNIEKSYKTFNG